MFKSEENNETLKIPTLLSITTFDDIDQMMPEGQSNIIRHFTSYNSNKAAILDQQAVLDFKDIDDVNWKAGDGCTAYLKYWEPGKIIFKGEGISLQWFSERHKI